MPLDSMQSYDYFKHRIVGRHLKFALIPRRCYVTKRRIWLESAYCVTSMTTGPGEPLFEYYWFDKDEYLIARLKDLI
jgi:hypothetical protein